MTSPAPLHVQWLVRLRWAAIAAQIASVFGVRFLLHAPFPLAPLVGIIGLLALANVALAGVLRLRPVLSQRAITANLLLDIAALTALLVWTGGAMNPFTTLYLLQVALAAVLVTRRWSLVVTLASTLAFGGLLLARPEAIHVWHSGAMFMLHVRGMWFAFALTAVCLWFFVDRVTTALRNREDDLARARLEALRAERLAALGTLAAGTAHELNTPLGTVAILAAELSDLLAVHPDERRLADQIRDEVRRCSEILMRMRAHHETPEPFAFVAVDAWLASAVAAWRSRRPDVEVTLAVAPALRDAQAQVQPDALRQAVEGVLENARAACDVGDRRVDIALRDGDGMLAIIVEDHGRGIPPEHLPRIGEPFFTTRAPGEGMGLGLFLATATLARLGGTLRVESASGTTRVAMRWPRAAPDASD